MNRSFKVGDIVRRTNDLGEYKAQRDYRINWIISDEAGASSLEDVGLSTVLNLVEDDIILVTEASADPNVMEQMSDEDLKARIEKLRQLRQGRAIRPIKATKEPKAPPTEEDNIITKLAKLSPEQIAKLKEKLGVKDGAF